MNKDAIQSPSLEIPHCSSLPTTMFIRGQLSAHG